MNIVNKLTLRYMKENKRRTLITIIGVIISVAMITSVATLFTSFITLFQNHQIANEGEWHILYKDVTEEQLEKIKSDKHTEKVVLSRDLGYSYLQDSENPSKPYLFFKQYDANGFKQFPIEVVEGRVPTKDDELLISEHIIENGKVNLKIADQITVNIGDRIAEDEAYADYFLGQNTSLRTIDNELAETIDHNEERQFTVVGIMKRPTWEPHIAPGFTVLSYLPDKQNEETVNASVVWNKVNRKTLENAEQLATTLNIEEISVNNGLLRYYGVINQDFLRSALYSVVAIIMIVIIIGSVSLIYNAFAISVSERSRQLGMLSSVGATKKQKRNSVFFEGFLIGIISIPFGIISGISGIAVTFHFINPLFQEISGISEHLTTVITPISIIIAVVISLLTIFISTYIPAQRASRVSAIDAIRQTQDIKLSRKNVKTSKFVRQLFGIEAEFGLKNLKRNKKRYNATVFSLAISIILFLTVTFFGDQIRMSSNMATSGINYDIKIHQNMNTTDQPFNESFVKSIASLSEVTNLSQISFAYVEAELTGDQVYELLGSILEDDKYNALIELNILDNESLRSYADELGIPHERLTDKNSLSGIIINKTVAPGEKIGQISAVTVSPGDAFPLLLSEFDWDGKKDRHLGDIEVAALSEKRPIGVDLSSGVIQVIVSKEVFDELNQVGSIEKTTNLVLTSIEPLVTHEKLEKLFNTQMHIDNHHKDRQEEESFILLLAIFTYGFITLITAICIANIFNTISTSISLRQREFGMLKSVGMTPKGFNRMIYYESLFYGIKSLLYGLPISIGIMYLIYHSMSEAFEYPFRLPWGSVIGVIVAVFFIVASAMLYSSAKVKKENIIDALKQENS